jgi:hypothetical protein
MVNRFGPAIRCSPPETGCCGGPPGCAVDTCSGGAAIDTTVILHFEGCFLNLPDTPGRPRCGTLNHPPCPLSCDQCDDLNQDFILDQTINLPNDFGGIYRYEYAEEDIGCRPINSYAPTVDQPCFDQRFIDDGIGILRVDFGIWLTLYCSQDLFTASLEFQFSQKVFDLNFNPPIWRTCNSGYYFWQKTSENPFNCDLGLIEFDGQVGTSLAVQCDIEAACTPLAEFV